MAMTRVLPALFAAAVFALPVTASAQTVIIVGGGGAPGWNAGWGPGWNAGWGPPRWSAGWGSRLGSRLGPTASPFICRLGSALGLGSPLECRLGWGWLLGSLVLTLPQEAAPRFASELQRGRNRVSWSP
jgi:hypothetical protein